MITNLSEGKPSTVLIRFSLPMLLSAMFQQLYNICDSVIAGKFAGEDALAAVGASYPITQIFMAIALGCNVGASVIISQLFGAKKYKDMKTAISTSFISFGVLSVVLTIFGLTLSGYMLKLLNTPENIMTDGLVYLNIYSAGLIFVFLYNICTGVFTALGDSNTPLLLLIGSSLGNVILDIIFVAPLKMGVMGVALATFIAQGIASIIAFIILIKRLKQIKTSEKYDYFSSGMLKKICGLAIPSVLQQSFVSVGNLFIQNLVNGFGSSVIAGYSAAIKLNTFAIVSFNTLGNGLSSYTAQNIGAGKYQRISKGFKSGMLINLCVVVPVSILFFFFGNTMLGLFLNDGSDQALETGITFLKIVSPFYIFVALKLACDGIQRGAGKMANFMISTFSDLILRVVLSFIFVKPFGSNGIWYTWPIGWIAATIIAFCLYIHVSHKWSTNNDN